MLPRSEYGTIDVHELPEGCVHIEGLRLQPLCKKLGIKYADALIGFTKVRGRYKPQTHGIVIYAADVPALMAALGEREQRAQTPDQRDRAKQRRQQRDIEKFADAIRDRFPGIPPGEELQIASHACQIGSNRVGRSRIARDPVRAAVVAYIRHNHTDYDELLGAGLDRDEARDSVADDVHAVLVRWETSAPRRSTE